MKIEKKKLTVIQLGICHISIMLSYLPYKYLEPEFKSIKESNLTNYKVNVYSN